MKKIHLLFFTTSLIFSIMIGCDFSTNPGDNFNQEDQLLKLKSQNTEVQSRADSVSQVRSNYGTGKTTWNASTGTFTFTASGNLNLPGKAKRFWIWDVPSDVKTIIIKSNVTVNAGFHLTHDMTIRGENRETSVIFGTNQKSWAQANNVRGYTIPAIREYDGGTCYIQNLTILNPRAFHVLGNGGKCHISDCNFIDTRGGGGNHSDGYAGGAGSTIDNCYFETGDDVIKLYHDITVTNTTIKMIQNAVPIQLGWGQTGNDKGVFRNLKIIGNDGRGNDNNAIIVGREGNYTKTIIIEGIQVLNPNATWISLRQSGQTVNGSVTNAYIKLKNYWGGFSKGKSNMAICGTTEKKTLYDCRNGDDDDDDDDDDNNDNNDDDNDNDDNNDDNAVPAVRLYPEPDYKGKVVIFTAGSYNQTAMVDTGLNNNDAHSIRVLPDYKATLFTGSNFDGSSKVFTTDAPRLGGKFSNQVSSLIIEYTGSSDDDDDDDDNNDDDNNNDDDDVVTVFAQTNYKNQKASLNPGSYNRTALDSILKKAGFPNTKDIESVKVIPGYRISLYTGNSFTGSQQTCTKDTPKLNNQVKSKVGSVIVESVQ